MPVKKLLVATEKGPVEVEGEVMHLPVDAKVVSFFVHEYGGSTVLTHYASGMRVGKLNPIKLLHSVRWGTGAQMSDREAAKRLIARAIDRNGVERVHAVFNAAPVINH